jgi:hypothetical protein
MAKQKKVTINHYLNKQLKPKEANGLLYYAPYTRVTYDRKNNKFPMDWDREFSGPSVVFHNRFTEDQFAKFLQDLSSYVWEVDRMIEQSIRYEHHFFGDDFQLKGFGERFELYRTTLYELFYEQVRYDIVQGLEQHIGKVELMKVRRALNDPVFTGDSLQVGEEDLKKYHAILPKELFDDINLCFLLSIYSVKSENEKYSRAATVFDWVVKGMRPAFENFIHRVESKKGFKYSPKLLDKLDLSVNKALSEVY